MSIGRKISAGFGLGLLMILVLGVMSYRSIQQQAQTTWWVQHTHEVLAQMEEALSVLKGAETGQRGYILTGHDPYLEPYQTATAQIKQCLDTVSSLTKDNPAQQQTLERVRVLVEAKLAELGETIRLCRAGGLQAALPSILTDQGKRTMDEIRSLVSQMEDREQALLTMRVAAADASMQRTKLTIVIGVPLSFLLLAIVGVIITQHIAPPLAALSRMAQQIARGDLPVQPAVGQRRDEISVLQESFGQMVTWLRAVASCARQIAGRDLTVSVTPQSDHDELGQSFALMIRNLRSMTGELQGQARDLEQRNEELQAQAEELSQQHEEMQQQAEELEQQGEELQAQSEELRAINGELAKREQMLQTLLESARGADGEEQVMQQVCQAALELMDGNAAASAVVEQVGENLVVRAEAGLGGLARHQWPLASSFAAIVIRHGRTAFVEDITTRPDLSVPQLPDRRFRSVLAAPLRLRDEVIGAVKVYGTAPRQWTAEDFRLVEWVAAQCSLVLETLRLQESLRQSEQRVQRKLDSVLSPEGDLETLELGDIIDVGAIQSLMDDFYKVAHIPASIIDLKGKMLVGVGWQEICMKFHRVHPETCRHCKESDTELADGIPAGQCRLYRCKNNMWDIATPILIGGQHVGNVFSGQFFFEGEEVDREVFHAQARRYGFDEPAYLRALEAVPRLSREAVDAGMGFLMKLSRMISLLSYSNIKLAQSLTARERSETQVRKLNRTLTALNNSSQAMAHVHSEAEFLSRACQIIVRDCGYVMVWIGYAQDDEAKTVRPVTYAGLERGYLESLRISWGDGEYGRGPTGTAIRTGQVSVCRDMLTDPAFSPWRAQALERGYASSIALPLVCDGRTMGALTIYCREADPFSPDEVELLAALASDLGQGIRTIRLRMAQVQAEEAVRRAKEVAEAASAAKDQFIAALSHELRTPLAPVMAATDSMLGDPRLPQDVQEDLAMIHRNVGLEVALIGDLLDVTRIAAGKLVLEKRPLDVARVLHDAARICRAGMDDSLKVLSVETPDGPYPMEGDPARLHQVFWNLINNAIKFTPPQGRITVRAVATDQTLRVMVRDTGVGIAHEALPKIFDRFEQGDIGTTRQFGGLGLGLAIAKAIVELHGGRISAHSEGRNKGSVFEVELPLVEDLSLPTPAEPAAGTSAAAGPVTIRSLKILLVEDHADTAKLMTRLLAAKGNQVTRADCIQAALLRAQQEQFDLLISDVGLPDGTGHDLMRQLIASGKRMPAIALSGYGSAADIERSKAVGFAEHLVKPVDLRTLQAVLDRVAGKL